MYLTKGIQSNQINFNRDFHGLINFCLETFIDAYVMKFLAPAVTKPSYCLLWRDTKSHWLHLCDFFPVFKCLLKLPPWIDATSFLLHVFACPRFSFSILLSELSEQEGFISTKNCWLFIFFISSLDLTIDVHNFNFYFLYM